MKAILRRVVASRHRPALRRLWNRLRHVGVSRLCPVCKSHLRRFRPHGIPLEDEAVCPVCESKAPHRLAYVFFATHPQMFRSNGLFLHIAPERELGRRLQEWAGQRQMTYRYGGISGSGEQYLDIRRLPFPDDCVDLIYCCHVLNCLQEDRVAMQELYRVLHPAGLAVLQVPAFHTGTTTLETNSLHERVRTFHDDGIYRCYTDEDYVRRLMEAGFHVERFRARDRTALEVRRYSLKQEVLHLCTKTNNAV